MKTPEIISTLRSYKVHLRLAGEQLRLTGETDNLPAALLELVKNNKAALVSFLQLEHQDIVPVPLQAHYPATDAQRSIWLLEQLHTGAYNIVTGLYLKGTVVTDAAFQKCIARHESLRTTFQEIDGALKQVVHDTIDFTIDFADITAVADIPALLKEQLLQLSYWKFDLAKGPLLKVKLYQVAADEYALILAIHHIISDGWSVRVLLEEVLQTKELPPLKIQYKDYSAWKEKRISAAAADFWLQQFEQGAEPMILPADLNRPAVRSFDGAIAKFFTAPELYTNITAYCKLHRVTPFTFFSTALTVLLHKLSGLDTIITGTPVAGRNHHDLHAQIGLYVNTLPLVHQVNAAESFDALLQSIHAAAAQAFAHQEYPFSRMAESYHWDTSRNPLFDVMLVLQDTAKSSGEGSDVRSLDHYLYGDADVIHREAPSKFDLTFNIGNDPDHRFFIEIEYATRIFSKENIISFYRAYQYIIAQVLEQPDMTVRKIEIADEAERQQLLKTFNDTYVEQGDKTIVDLIEAQVLRTPDATALLYEGRSFSYRQVNELANRLANYLRSEYQIGAESLVGIRQDRNEWLIISLLAVLKAGGAYVPIDPAYPEERIAYILADSKCKVLLDARELQKFLFKANEYERENLSLNRVPAHLAYIIYTSGSTGHPKGVMITHGNVQAFMEWCRREFSNDVYEVVLGVTSVCFDLSVFEIFFTLMSGRQLRLLSSALEIRHYLHGTQPLLLNTVPGVVSHLLSDGVDLTPVKVLNMAGEPVPPAIVQSLNLQDIAVRNLYGPSEDTTYSTMYRFYDQGPVLIGKPIDNTQVYVLNNELQLQPVGVPGEICISGAGLARGYLHKAALTAEKFVAHPFRKGERLYRTGDIGKWQSDGHLVYMGRKDDQVKIRGFRIEPGEVTATLQAFPGVEAAIVIAVKDALVAYVVGSHERELRSWLESRLPHYMVPAHFIQLSALPLLPNGKVNKKALPLPELANRPYLAPGNETEAQLVEIWKEVLDVPVVSADDHFFDRGGQSLKATRLASHIEKVFGCRIALKDFFLYPLLSEQAQLLAAADKQQYRAIPLVPVQDSYAVTPAQQRLWVLSQLEDGSVAYNMPGVFVLEKPLDKARLQVALQLLIARHESLRTVFRETDGTLRQVVLPAIDFQIGSDFNPEDIYQPFDLANGPLLRVNLTDGVLAFVMHHIISDGWSLDVLIREVLQLYKGTVLPPLRIQYKDYAAWLTVEEQDEWEGEIPRTTLIPDKVRPAMKTFNGAVYVQALDADLIDQLEGLCQRTGSTLFMGLLAVVKAVLYRYTDQEDMIVGSPVAGRDHIDLEDQIGFYVNTLPFRTRLSGEDSLETLIGKVREVTLSAYAKQASSIEESLFDVLVVLQQDAGMALLQKEFQLKPYEGLPVYSKFDLQFSFAEEGNLLQLTYNTDLYNRDTISQLASHLLQLMRVMTAAPAQPLGQIALTAAPVDMIAPSDAQPLTLRSSNDIALVADAGTMTYAELDVAANKLGGYLQQVCGVQKGDIVGIQLEKGQRMIVAMWGVLKTGAAFLPIDPAYPQSRIDYMIADSGCKVVIDADFHDFPDFPDGEGGELHVSIDATDLAYVIYTSGSTGQPKGVMVSHGALYEYINAIGAAYKLEQGERILQLSSFSFDASLEQIMLSMLHGGTLYVPNKELTTDTDRLSAYIAANGITHVHSVPTLLKELEFPAGLRRVVSAGEVCPATLVEKVQADFYNKYGPTEATISATIHQARKGIDYSQGVPVGRPLSNSRVYVLNAWNQLQPPGVAGEICIGGHSLAQGYLGQPGLTAEKFVPDPFHPGALMYRTGDIGRWKDGELLFMGRKDDQVKINGHRIELGEIEHVLSGYGGIVKAINGQLVAYVKEEVDRVWLSTQLPHYMHPAHYIVMDAMPLLSNGKVDRKSLPLPTAEKEYIAPRTAIEKQLVHIWEEILRQERIGITDHFFELGGQSLKATRLVSRINQLFNVKMGLKEVFMQPLLAAQAEWIAGAAKEAYNAISVAAKADSYVLSSSQRRLWVISQFEEGSAAYHIPGKLELGNEVDVNIPALNKAFQSLIERHEILRTVFREIDGEVRQVVLPAISFGLNTGQGKFDLANGPLLRADVNDNVCSFVMHHIISDGWSMDVMKRELLQLYHGGELAPLQLQYKDYAEWQQQQDYQEDEQYWKGQFAGEIPVLELPAEKVRPAVKTYRGGHVYRQLDAAVTKKLRAFAFDHTIFTVLLTGVNAFLYRYTGQEDIVIGTPVSGREHAGLEEQIGFYVNTLALRTRFSGADTFADLLANVKEVLLSAYAHQAYPFDRLVDALDIRRDLSRHPLFDVMVVLQQELDVQSYEGLEDYSKFDLQFSFVEEGDKLGLYLTYNSDIYHGAAIAQMGDHFVQFLSAVNTTDAIGQLDYLQLQPLQGAAISYPSGKTVVDLIIEQAIKTPDLIALQYGDKTFTYREVDQLTSRFAGYLQSQYGIVANDLVGVQLERSEWMPLAILGVLKAGGAYVPVGTDYPSERVAYIRQDAGMKVLIDEKVIAGFEGEYEFAYRSSGLSGLSGPGSSGPSGLLGSSGPSGDDLAYCIYTSGSTGTPKGVLNTHAGLYNRLLWMQDYLQVNATDVFLQKTPYTFDVSVWELILPFMCGSKLVVLPPDQHKDPLAMQEVIERAGVNIIHFVPSMLGAFLPEVSGCTSLKHIVCSGEELPGWMLDMTRQKLPDVRIHNLYGPTEAAIDVTAINLTDEKEVTIGYPVSNTTISIVNAYDQLQPALVAGELLIGGVQVAKGYLNLPELTADRFRDGHYRTGDIARYLPDGQIQYLGRRDNQVKIRGNRIELGEVEAALSSHPQVTQVVAMAREVSGEKVLVAYYTRTGIRTEIRIETETGIETVIETGAKTEIEIGIQTETGAATIDNSYLRSRLPGYMLPDYYVQLPSFPLTASGKVDRKLLPSPTGTAKEYIAPRTGVEYKLSKIWEEILGKQAGVKDNFFELGGHSLKATRLVSQINKAFGVKIGLKDVFTSPSLEEQAQLISVTTTGTYTEIPTALPAASYILSSAQRRLWVLSQFEQGSEAYHIPAAFEIEGLLDLDTLSQAFDQLIARHEILRTVFRAGTSDEMNEVNEVMQYVLPAIPFSIENEISNTPFDLENGPLLRAAIQQTGPQKWLFTFVMHHIISDGWSMDVLMKEVLELYHGNVPAPLRIQYKDYAVWQQQQTNEEDAAYWKAQFAGELPVLELPADHLRPVVKTYNGAHVSRYLSGHGWRELCQRTDSTLFMWLVAGVNALLYRFTGQSDIIIGSPIAGREHADLENQIGFYVNTLALRTRFSGEDSFETLMSHVRDVTLSAYAHQAYPFDTLVDVLQLKRDVSRSPLFDVLVVLQQPTASTLPSAGLKIKPLTATRDLSKFDLQFTFIEEEHGLALNVTYNKDIYLAATIERLTSYLELLLLVAAKDPAQAIGSIPFLPHTDREIVAVPFRAGFTISNDIALVTDAGTMTYAELDVAANKLGGYLQQVCGVQKGDIVGIQLEKGQRMIVAMWGVLKAGAAFLPIDPAYPQSRIDYMIADSGCKLVIDADFPDCPDFPDGEDNELHVSIYATDLAYVIYTSGSTGQPKGVMVSHGALYQYINAIGAAYNLEQGERILQLSSFSFDASLEQIMLSMLHGGTLYVPSKELTTDTDRLSAYIAANGITHVHSVPTLLKELEFSASIRRVVSAGEVCPAALVEKVQADFYNKYGPTEATISATIYKVKKGADYSQGVPVGRPLSNSRVYVLNAWNQLQPPGVAGEICIGGHSLAQGYLGQPGLTAEKFVPDPFHPGALMYRTGDIGRWKDGELLFMGRKDDQVKINGHRIELGEIEHVLSGYGGIVKAIDGQLVAYVKEEVDRVWLSTQLPHYMHPAHYIVMDAMPLLPNGKVDRKSLPLPTAEKEYIAPRTDLEKQLAHIWEEILQRERIGITDNFFELGGHSLKATRLVSRIQKEFGIRINIKDVFLHPTIETVGALIRAEQWLEHANNNDKEDRILVEL